MRGLASRGPALLIVLDPVAWGEMLPADFAGLIGCRPKPMTRLGKKREC